MRVRHEDIAFATETLHQRGGLPRGDSTGWSSVDEFYTVGMRQWTLITGTPNSGKSEWLDALMVNLAEQGRWKFCIFSPENQPLELHHAKILEKHVGKPFNPGPTERMSIDEVHAGEEWMADKFLFFKPEKMDMKSILGEMLDDGHISHSATWKAGVVIDPWNWLEHHRPAHWSETEYVSALLTEVVECVRAWNMHLFLVAHPAKMQPRKDGTYAVPTPRDIAGSAHFWNKADNCITVYRNQSEPTQEVEIHVQKVRWKHIGRIGTAKLDYDRVTGRYNEQPGRSWADEMRKIQPGRGR